MSRASVERAAAKCGARVVVNKPAPDLDVEVHAPKGQHWAEGSHVLVGAQDAGGTAADVWADLRQRMDEGLKPCGPGCQ